MSSDPRDSAAAAAAAVAGEIVSRAPDLRVGVARTATGDASQVETLAEAIATHCAALPRKYGVVDRMTVYDGDAPIGEFEGGGGAALDVARFLVLRATMEGKRLSFLVGVTAQGGEREVCRWRFFARPDANGSPASAGDPSIAPGWNAIESAKLQAIHNHQLVQELIKQSREHAAQIGDVIRAQSETLRAIGTASAKVLDQLSAHAQEMGRRAHSAEERAATIAADARAIEKMSAEAIALADEATRAADEARRDRDADPTRKVVEGAVRGITEGIKLKIAGVPAEQSPTNGSEGTA